MKNPNFFAAHRKDLEKMGHKLNLKIMYEVIEETLQYLEQNKKEEKLILDHLSNLVKDISDIKNYEGMLFLLSCLVTHKVYSTKILSLLGNYLSIENKEGLDENIKQIIASGFTKGENATINIKMPKAINIATSFLLNSKKNMQSFASSFFKEFLFKDFLEEGSYINTLMSKHFQDTLIIQRLERISMF